MEKSNKLTTKKYWDRQHENDLEKSDFRPIVIRLDKNLAFSEIDKIYGKYLPKGNDLKFIEIGCSPGKWMAYFLKNFGYNVSGLEYAENGFILTQKNLATLEINANLIKGDIFDNNLKDESYNVVFSHGLIEHFDDPEDAIKSHLRLLKKGGFLVLAIPNFRGFNYFFQKLTNSKLLEQHNLKIMNKDFFYRIGKTFKLHVVTVDYYGLINFVLFQGSKTLVFAGKIIQFILSHIYFLLGKRLPLKNHSFLSPYVIAIYTKPE